MEPSAGRVFGDAIAIEATRTFALLRKIDLALAVVYGINADAMVPSTTKIGGGLVIGFAV